MAKPSLKRRAASCPEGRYSCLALLPMGVAWPRILLCAPVVSYTTFSPSLAKDCQRQSTLSGLFLWPDPAGSRSSGLAAYLSPPRMLSGIVLYGVRTFLDAQDKPSPAYHHTAITRPAWVLPS